MSTHIDQEGAKPNESTDPDEIEAEIEATREDLKNTVDALSHKLDVKSQAQDRVAELKGRAQATLSDPDRRSDALQTAAPVLGAVAALAIVVGVLRRVVHK